MKKISYGIIIAACMAITTSCATYSTSNGRGNHGMPPGQAKKIFGTKSAKPFAPGQQKKGRGKHHNDVFYYDTLKK